MARTAKELWRFVHFIQASEDVIQDVFELTFEDSNPRSTWLLERKFDRRFDRNDVIYVVSA